jgi:hypothetical protein
VIVIATLEIVIPPKCTRKDKECLVNIHCWWHSTVVYNYTLPTPAGGEASRRIPPTGCAFLNTFWQWQRLVASVLPLVRSLPSWAWIGLFLKFTGSSVTNRWFSQVLTYTYWRQWTEFAHPLLPTHCCPPQVCVSSLLVSEYSSTLIRWFNVPFAISILNQFCQTPSDLGNPYNHLTFLNAKPLKFTAITM